MNLRSYEGLLHPKQNSTVMSEEGVDHEEVVPYAETSAFTRLLMVPSRVKIIDVFLGKHYTTLSRGDIAGLAGVDPSTVSRNIEEIVDLGIIEEAESRGRATHYRLNKKSRLAQILGRARDELGRESDTVPRRTQRGEKLSLSSRSQIQDTLRNYRLDRTEESPDERPRPSEHITVEHRGSRTLGVEG